MGTQTRINVESLCIGTPKHCVDLGKDIICTKTIDLIFVLDLEIYSLHLCNKTFYTFQKRQSLLVENVIQNMKDLQTACEYDMVIDSSFKTELVMNVRQLAVSY
jgi:hypothetical protein